MLNLKNSSKGLDENMEALKHNFLFRWYFKKKEKAAAKLKEAEELMKADVQKNIEEKK